MSAELQGGATRARRGGAAMSARGFTLTELVVVIAISATLVPLVYVLGRGVTSSESAALAELEAAGAVRSISEELRRDLRTHRIVSEAPLVLEGPGPCARLEYVVEGSALLRRGAPACGTLGIAAHVRALEPTPAGLLVRFARDTGGPVPFEARFLVPWGPRS